MRVELLIAAVVVAQALFVEQVIADTFGSLNPFDIEFVTVGNPGNPDDTGKRNTGGRVDYTYRISKYEISEAMIDSAIADGGLRLTKDTRGPDKPATSISWLEAATFVNWLNTSHGHQAAYNIDRFGYYRLWTSIEAWQRGGENLFRHKDAVYFLPSMDEWYKAAYYDPASGVYYDYPTGSDSVPDGIDFAGDPNFDAVFDDGGFNSQPNDITNAGALSPYGTIGQGGNVWEWEETERDLVNDSQFSTRGVRGGVWDFPDIHMTSLSLSSFTPGFEFNDIGFRVASIVPEPSSSLACLAMGAVALARRKRR